MRMVSSAVSSSSFSGGRTILFSNTHCTAQYRLWWWSVFVVLAGTDLLLFVLHLLLRTLARIILSVGLRYLTTMSNNINTDYDHVCSLDPASFIRRPLSHSQE